MPCHVGHQPIAQPLQFDQAIESAAITGDAGPQLANQGQPLVGSEQLLKLHGVLRQSAGNVEYGVAMLVAAGKDIFLGGQTKRGELLAHGVGCRVGRPCPLHIGEIRLDPGLGKKVDRDQHADDGNQQENAAIDARAEAQGRADR